MYCKIILSFTLFSFTFLGVAQEKYAIPGQSDDFPLFTEINTNDLKKFEGAFRFPNPDMEKIRAFRNFVRPFAFKQDPFGEFLYANTFDLYPFGLGDSVSADTAIYYCKRAADQNLAMAENFLYDAYKYGLMTLKENPKTALMYLRRLEKHGNWRHKAEVHRKLALLYYNGDFKEIKIDTLEAKRQLELSLQYDSIDTWTIDFLAGIHEELDDYKKAMFYRLKSGNEQSHLKVAEWLIEGKHVDKDFERGLAIIFEEAENLLKRQDNIHQYMGSRNPILMLNKLYWTKMITKEQLGKFYKPDFIYDE